MALQPKPDMEFIWASGGAIVQPSDVKVQTGWTPEVPPHQWENYVQNRQDQYLAHINQRGFPEWDGNTEYEAGGLSYVQGSNGVVYKSVAASGPATTVQDPTTDVSDTYWAVAFAATTQASETVAGIAELATTAEAETGSDDARIMTPLKVKQAIDAFVSDSLPLNYFSGLTLANNSGAPLTTVDVGIGTCRNTTDTVDINITAVTRGILQASGSWAAGDNQNKLDTGAKAISTWYHVFAIRKTSDGSGDILFSLSATSPTMPSGYAGHRRISSIRTDASGNILGFINVGARFVWKTPVVDIAIGVNTTKTLYVIKVPTGVRVLGKVGIQGNGGDFNYWVEEADAGAMPASMYYGVLTGIGDDRGGQPHEIITNTSGQLVAQTGSAVSALNISTLGWSEIRG